jgi:siroheme synthase
MGRGGEEARALCAAGIPCEIVPGVSAALAVPACAGIPVTYRRVASSVAIVTGHQAPSDRGVVKWGELARTVDTLIILMGLGNLREIMNGLLNEGCRSDHPVALIQSGSLPAQKTVVGTVSTIVDLAAQHGFESPTGDCRRPSGKFFSSARHVSENVHRRGHGAGFCDATGEYLQ